MSNKIGNQTTEAREEDVTALLEHEPEVMKPDVASESLQNPSTTRRRKTLLISIAIVIVAVIGDYFVRSAFLYEDTDDAQIHGHVMPLSARINGQVQEVRVIEGQLVHAGDVLVVIDPKDYKIAVNQARANLADAEATAASSMWSVPVTSATAWSTLDSSQTAIDNAGAGVKAAERNLESANANAQVDQRKAQLDQTELDLSYTMIRSPVNGIVGRKTAEVGQNVSIGQELVDVVPLDDVWVTANFKETQLEHMRAGQPVEIKIDAYGRSWKAHVTNLGGGTGSVFSLLPPENATGNYVKVVQRVPVRIDFDP